MSYNKLSMKEKKEVWWNHLLDNKQFWHFGWTKRRLQKRKEDITNSRHTWSDLMDRHGGNDESPDEMKWRHENRYFHCISNFAANIGLIIRLGMK